MSKKYKPGEGIITLDELYEQEFIFWRNRVVNRGWFGSWQIRWAKQQITQKLIRKAIKIEEETK